MKNVLTVLAICLTTTLFAQSNNLKGNVTFNKVKIENLKIAVEVDSVEEIESTFSVEDFEKILDETGNNEDIIFSIKCNDKKVGDDVKSHIKYEIKGNTDNKKEFLKNIAKLRKAALKYYNSKK